VKGQRRGVIGERKIEHEEFDCPKIGTAVRIVWAILIHRDSITRAIDDWPTSVLNDLMEAATTAY
jgi:hypothetical protein